MTPQGLLLPAEYVRKVISEPSSNKRADRAVLTRLASMHHSVVFSPVLICAAFPLARIWSCWPGRIICFAGEAEGGSFRVESGDVLAGGYRLDRLLGRGGMGEVRGGLHDTDPGQDDVRQFVREATVAARLQHRETIAVSDADESDGRLFIATELPSGRDPGKALAAHHDGLPLGPALDCGIQLADALAAAHRRGIIHRDLKPANLFIQTDERLPGGRLKVSDFSLARDPASFIEGHPGFGTPARVPFKGPSLPTLMAQHLSQSPAPPSDLKPRIPGCAERPRVIPAVQGGGRPPGQRHEHARLPYPHAAARAGAS